MNNAKKTIRHTAVGAIAALTLTYAATASGGQFDGVTLTVATWGGAWKDTIDSRIAPKFEALGGRIEYVTGSPQANLAKVIAARGRAPFDVMEVLDAQEKDFFETNEFIQQIDVSRIPNAASLDEWQYNSWRIASWHTQEGICYNKDKFAELGLEPPSTYLDLANEKLAGRISIPDISSGGGLAGLGAMTYAAGGDETNVDPGLELIRKLDALKFWSAGGEVVTQFQSGDVYAAVMHTGWCVRTLNAGVNVGAVHPRINDEHTGVHKYGWLVIMKNSENAEAAHWFLNEYLDPDYQFEFATSRGVVPVNKTAIERMKDDPVLVEMVQLDPNDIARQLRLDYSKADISNWIDRWNRSVSQ